MNYKEDVFGVDEFEIATKHNLDLVQKDGNRLEYKDKIETQFSKYSKYSYLKHLKKKQHATFLPPNVELKLVNNVTTTIHFFQESIHEQKDFESKFCIQIIPEPMPFKYYNYFDFFDFFEFYQIHKTAYSLDVGRVSHAYLSQADIEIFTMFEKFMDLEGKYKGIFNYRVYFLVHKGGQLTTIKTENVLNMYIPKTVGEVLKEDNNKALFDYLSEGLPYICKGGNLRGGEGKRRKIRSKTFHHQIQLLR